MAPPSSTPRATQDQTASDDMGALIGRMLESGRAPSEDGRSERYEVEESWGRSFLMSELTTAASLAGSRVNLANSAPPRTRALDALRPLWRRESSTQGGCQSGSTKSRGFRRAGDQPVPASVTPERLAG